MRLGLVLLSMCLAAPAFAEPAGEVSGFVGVDYLSPQMLLGNSWSPERYTGSSPVLGARMSFLIEPDVAASTTHFAWGVEAELAMTPTYTSGSPGEMTYFAPLIGYRAHLIGRFGDDHFSVHAVAGAGALTYVSSAPFVPTDTEAQLYAGLGFGLPAGHFGSLRFDVRDAFMRDIKGGYVPTYEVQLGLSRSFGGVPRVAPVPPADEDQVQQTQQSQKTKQQEQTANAATKDSDGDGFPDATDKCPNEPETVNGIEDADGCPEKDSDGDGVLDPKDKCPGQAEDHDNFQDDDGCPDPDNDNDGIADGVDVCPNQPETYNGFHDDDGCPDEVPELITKALTEASEVRFERGGRRLVHSSTVHLRPLIGIMQAQPEMRIVITAHPEKAGAAAAKIATQRAEAVRFFLQDQGIAVMREDIPAPGAVAAKGPAIELTLAFVKPAAAAAAPAPAAGTPAATPPK